MSFFYLKFTAGSLIFLTIFTKKVISLNRAPDLHSMKPSFNPRVVSNNSENSFEYDYLLLWKNSYLLDIWKKNKIVAIYHPYKQDFVIRYLVGLPGDWVKQKNSNFYHQVPEGHCWVECLKGEEDSSQWGPVILF